MILQNFYGAKRQRRTVPQEEKMSAISELIRSEADGTISFGDYTLDAKAKLDNFGHQEIFIR